MVYTVSVVCVFGESEAWIWTNGSGGVIDGVFALSVVDHGVEPRSVEPKTMKSFLLLLC